MKAVALCPAQTLTLDLLPEEISGLGRQGDQQNDQEKSLENLSLDEIERDHVLRVLTATEWHRGRACEILGVSRPRLRRMMRHHQIDVPGGLENHD